MVTTGDSSSGVHQKEPQRDGERRHPEDPAVCCHTRLVKVNLILPSRAG